MSDLEERTSSSWFAQPAANYQCDVHTVGMSIVSCYCADVYSFCLPFLAAGAGQPGPRVMSR